MEDTMSATGTPSHTRLRHRKSGARGFRLLSRLSHIGPPHLGQSGLPVTTGSCVDAPSAAGCLTRRVVEVGLVVAAPALAVSPKTERTVRQKLCGEDAWSRSTMSPTVSAGVSPRCAAQTRGLSWPVSDSSPTHVKPVS